MDTDNFLQPRNTTMRGINDFREIATAKIRGGGKEHYDANKTNLEPLQVGDIVAIQNLAGDSGTDITLSKFTVLIESFSEIEII